MSQSSTGKRYIGILIANFFTLIIKMVIIIICTTQLVLPNQMLNRVWDQYFSFSNNFFSHCRHSKSELRKFLHCLFRIVLTKIVFVFCLFANHNKRKILAPFLRRLCSKLFCKMFASFFKKSTILQLFPRSIISQPLSSTLWRRRSFKLIKSSSVFTFCFCLTDRIIVNPRANS